MMRPVRMLRWLLVTPFALVGLLLRAGHAGAGEKTDRCKRKNASVKSRCHRFTPMRQLVWLRLLYRNVF